MGIGKVTVGCSRCTNPRIHTKNTTSLANDFAVVRLKKKGKGTFYYSYISDDEFIFFDGFSLIPKSRRRGKLQSLRLHIKSKTKGACM